MYNAHSGMLTTKLIANRPMGDIHYMINVQVIQSILYSHFVCPKHEDKAELFKPGLLH